MRDQINNFLTQGFYAVSDGLGETMFVAETAADAQKAIKEGTDKGWKLLGFDMTLPKPVVVFQES
jgi:hypothetical protein